jgi:hypothetical protein
MIENILLLVFFICIGISAILLHLANRDRKSHKHKPTLNPIIRPTIAPTTPVIQNPWTTNDKEKYYSDIYNIVRY